MKVFSNHVIRTCYLPLWLLLGVCLNVFAQQPGELLSVRLLSGATGLPISDHAVTAYELFEDGTEQWTRRGLTDAAGKTDLFLPGLSSGNRYVLKTLSPFDGRIKVSSVISAAGTFVFVAGNKLLNVTVTDGISNSPLGLQEVGIFRRESDGSLLGLRVQQTDKDGHLSLDLPGLGSGIDYVLRTAMKYGSRMSYTEDIKRTGNLAFKAGNVRVKAINGNTNAVLNGQRIGAYERLQDGSDIYASSATTDDKGLADFDLPNLGSKTYVFKAQSLHDGRWLSSPVVQQPGVLNFVVGNQLLHVKVADGINKTPLGLKDVIILRRESDGSLKGFQTVTTDAEGRISLDLPGLGSGTVYALRMPQPFGSGRVFSSDITRTGNFEFTVGNLQLRAFDGASGSALPNQDVTVMEEMVDGSLLWFAHAVTDEKGLIPLHLPGLGQGRKYVLKTQTRLDQRWVKSGLITRSGVFEFTVGNKLLNVQMMNALSGKALAHIEISAYELMPDLSLRGFQRKTTDASGNVDFDLTGLGQGASYVLRARPYGNTIDSEPLDSTGQFQFKAGNIAVNLYKAKTSEVLPGHTINLFEQGTDGQLIWRAAAVTDTQGLVRFDPKGLGDGRRFVVRAQNVFGNDKNHFSRWINKKGWVEFAVDSEDPDKLDDKPPVFIRILPGNDTKLSDQGFQIRMQIRDNQTVDRVRLAIFDPVSGALGGYAEQQMGEWVFTVPNSILTTGQTLTVYMVAFDKVGNSTVVSRRYQIIKDTQPPILNIRSHRDGDQIDEHGFSLFGNVSDNTAVKTLTINITDPLTGVIENNRELEVGANGYWGLAVKGLSRGQEISITLNAVDWAGNRTQKKLLLPVMTETVSAVQLLNRITFGATPELLQDVRRLGSAKFLQQQLHPELINDSAFDSYLKGLLAQETMAIFRLQHAQLARAIHSKKQLLEVMTWFWENHFNTDRSQTDTDFEIAENQGFRAHALGRFRDLLGVSAKSPAMLLFLDNHFSHKDEPNENYARELLELHTLGVDNGYSAKDIAEVAKVFTGWRVSDRTFDFAPWKHDNGERVVLNTVIPPNSGVDAGEQVLDLLAAHPATAEFICTKLLKLLQDDHPAEAAVADCAADFIEYAQNDNQIAMVLEGILKSAAFSDSSLFHNKVKNPLEFVSGVFRQLPVELNYAATRNHLRQMGMNLFYYPDPTGWPETTDHWVNSGQMTQRWLFTGKMLTNRATAFDNYWQDPAQLLIDQGVETGEGVLAYLFELVLNHDYSAMEYAAVWDVLTDGNTKVFDLYDDQADTKLRKIMAMIMTYPAYQLQ